MFCTPPPPPHHALTHVCSSVIKVLSERICDGYVIFAYLYITDAAVATILIRISRSNLKLLLFTRIPLVSQLTLSM